MNFDKFKLNFNFITNIFLLFILFFGGIIWADTNGIWTNASDVRGGTFGSDEQPDTTNFTFMNDVYFIDIDARTQLNDLASDKVSTNNLKLSTIQNCTGKLYTNSSGNVVCGSIGDSFPTCNSGEFLTYNGTALTCTTVSGGSGSGGSLYTGNLTNNVHTGLDCTNALGVVLNDSTGNYFCKFQESSCSNVAGGWTQYNGWSQTKSNSCKGVDIICGGISPLCWGGSTGSGAHFWSNNLIIESSPYTTCSLVSGGCYDRPRVTRPTLYCSASRTIIGCY